MKKFQVFEKNYGLNPLEKMQICGFLKSMFVCINGYCMAAFFRYRAFKNTLFASFCLDDENNKKG